MKQIFYNFIAVVCFLLCGCSGDGSDDSILIIMSWNVQNLFDDIDNGTEYREFDPANGEWDHDDFTRKASALADVITAAVPGGPDIVLLQEVENENALQHLEENYLKSDGYRYILFLPTENSAVGCGVLSRVPISSVNSHAVNCGGKIMGRNISEVDFILPGSDGAEPAQALKVFINHWKSKLGGAPETEPYRLAAASMLSGLMTASAAESPQTLILAAGDFNESHDEFNRTCGAYQTAIMPAALAESISDNYSPLLYSADPAELSHLSSGDVFFNPWAVSAGGGSYYYNGSWETIDQFFLNNVFFDESGWEYDRFFIGSGKYNSTDDGLPLKWQTSTGDGYSDHFPVILELKPAE